MECGQQRSKVKMLLFQYGALHKFPVINGQTCMIRFCVLEGPNTPDQISLSAFLSFLVQVQTKLAS